MRTAWSELLNALGTSELEFALEEAQVLLDAKGWLARRLAAIGYIKQVPLSAAQEAEMRLEGQRLTREALETAQALLSKHGAAKSPKPSSNS